jgi:hypothetical protein
METLNVKKNKAQTGEQIFYFHPIFTTLAFIFTLPYYFSLVYFAYKSWNNKDFDIVLPYLLTFLLFAPISLKILKAFIRFTLGKPAIRVTDFQLNDYLNNVDVRWADIKKLLPFNLRWWSLLSIEVLSEPKRLRQINSPIKRLLMTFNQFMKRKRILKINLLLLEGKNVDILSSIKLHSQKK